MKIEQDRPDEVSSKAKALIEKLVIAEEVLDPGYGYSENERKKREQELEGIKQEANQVIVYLGDQEFSVFFEELDKLVQEAKARDESNVNEYCVGGVFNPQLGDFYDNEARASSIGLAKNLRAIESVRKFFHQLQTPPATAV